MTDRTKKTPAIIPNGYGRAAKFGVIGAALISFIAYSAGCGGSGPANHDQGGLPPAANVSEASPTPYTVPDNPNVDYSRFTHGNEAHAKLPCLLCHQTDESPTKLKFPGKSGHLPCAGCHVEQFKNPQGVMCGICHTDSSTGTMQPFPTLTSFNAKFDHSKHVSQASCSACHKPTQRGAGFSVPTRSNAHATCFQCHGPETTVAKTMAERGTVIDTCSTCHTAGRPGPAHTFAKYSGGFVHAQHVKVRGLNCNSCHTIRGGSGEGQVSAPLMAMHKASGRTQSCATCHNGKRAFGADDFANCKRCHQGNTFNF